jgi:hypothetical protein
VYKLGEDMENNEFISLVLRRKYRILAFAMFIIFLIVFLQFGFLDIQINQPNASTNINYQITKQGSAKSDNRKSSSGHLTKLLSRGNYELLINQDDKSAFNVAKINGFFTKTKISTQLEQEKDRQFVGNNPTPCVFYADSLYSYDCNGSFNEITRHVPATADTPTYTDVVNSGQGGEIVGIINTKSGRIALVSNAEADEPQNPYVAYVLNNYTATNPTPLKDLSPDRNYFLKPYQEGFVVYDDNYENFYYYPSISSTPQTITMSKPKDKNLRPYDLEVNGKSILIAYSDQKLQDISDEVDRADQSENSTTTFVLWDGSSSSEHKVNYAAQQSKLCGQDICALSKGVLHVIEGGSKRSSKELFSVNNVEYIENVGNSFVVARNHEVINLGTAKKSGFIEVSLNDYKNCGISPDTDTSYILCLINNKNKKVALRVDQSAPNKDSIDKKIEQLQKQNFVSDVSINGRYIFISPNAGDLSYQTQTNSYGYDSATLKKATDEINSEVSRLSIDPNTYSVNLTIK